MRDCEISVKSCVLFCNRVLKQKLNEVGIGAALHYPRPLHLQQAYNFMDHKRGAFPVSEQAADRVLSLPNYPEMTDEMVGEVVERLKEIMRW